MSTILIINGSYRDDGITDQAVDLIEQIALTKGVNVEQIRLRDTPIEFCLNCRECTQQPGEKPGVCVQHDAMHEIVEKIEHADAFVLASPTNFGSVTAIFKRFLERLVVYAYWPWSKDYPVFRKAKARNKKAIIVTSSAAPAWMARLFFSTGKQLKMTAKTIGARSVGCVITGLISKDRHPELPKSTVKHIDKMMSKII